MESIEVCPRIESTDGVVDFVDSYLKAVCCPPGDIWNILSSVDELFTNIALYSNSAGNVTIRCQKNADTVSVRLEDSGAPFNPLLARAPGMSKKASEREIGGLGILICKKLMDGIFYEYAGDKNILTIVKVLNKSV